MSFYRKLGSNPTKIISKDGRTADVLGETMFVAASQAKVAYIGKDKKEVTTGCISGVDISMISDVAYQDTVSNEITRNLDLIGMYDETKIYEKIRAIVQQQITEILTKKTPGSIPTPEAIETQINSLFSNWFSIKPNSVLAMNVLVQNFMINSTNFEKNNLASLKQQYQNCPADQFFYIPLTIIPFIPITYKKANHANGIFIRKSKGTVFRVEPQYYVDKKEGGYQERQAAINRGVIQLTNEIGLKDPTFVDIKVPCPQAIVEDTNCMFWSIYIFEAIIKNIYKKDINAVIQEISSLPKAELEKLMYEYKRELFDIWIPKILQTSEIKWPDFENNKAKILDELYTEFYGIPPPKPPAQSPYPVRIGGKTRKQKNVRKTRRSKKRLARR